MHKKTLQDGVPSERLSLIAPATTFAGVEVWRKTQRPVLTKSQAWRALVERGLAAEAKAGA